MIKLVENKLLYIFSIAVVITTIAVNPVLADTEINIKFSSSQLREIRSNLEKDGYLPEDTIDMVIKNLKSSNKKVRSDQTRAWVEYIFQVKSIKDNAAATSQDPYRKNADAAAMQRYLMNNQTGSYPFKRTDQTIESERQIDRTNHQMRVERGMNESRERQRNAAACMFGNSNCK
jgi:peptidoglycan hydrolase-like protein with peptidoglycan-binding domain